MVDKQDEEQEEHEQLEQVEVVHETKLSQKIVPRESAIVVSPEHETSATPVT